MASLAFAPTAWDHPVPVTSSSAPALPAPRGPISEFVVSLLRGEVDGTHVQPDVDPMPLGDEDHALALYLLYELHYRGFADVDEELEWDPAALRIRRELERHFLASLRDEVGPVRAGDDVVEDLRDLLGGDGPSLAAWCDEDGDHWHLREQAIHRSAYQLKEADPHSWALPRIDGGAKAALARIQFDEYGEGVERDMHATLFALHLERLGLDPSYGAYLDVIPGTTLATTNLVTLFGLHRRWRGALIGHLALFEAASVPVMAAYSAALRRLGYDAWTRLFYDVHVTADAEHQTVALDELAAGLVAQEPQLHADVVFGATALGTLERLVTMKTLAAWELGQTSLLGDVAVGEAPGLVEDRRAGEDPRPR